MLSALLTGKLIGFFFNTVRSTATTAMTHIAIVEKLDGKSADWMEKVSDEQYQG